MLAEEDRNAEEKSPLDGAWYKRKQNNSGERRLGAKGHRVFKTLSLCNMLHGL